jgi:hypothetical protein
VIIIAVVLWRPDGLLHRVPAGVPQILFGIRLRAARPARPASRPQTDLLVGQLSRGAAE